MSCCVYGGYEHYVVGFMPPQERVYATCSLQTLKAQCCTLLPQKGKRGHVNGDSKFEILRGTVAQADFNVIY